MANTMVDVKMILGANYVHGKYSSENSEEVKDHYRTIVAINEKLFDQIPYKVIFSEEDTYSSAKQMREEVQRTGIIYIYSGGCEHPYLTPEENMKGRAVHDVFAHMICGCPFSFRGELNAYYTQRKYYPEEVWATLFAEIPMQTAAYYYTGGHNFPQRALKATKQEMQLVEHLAADYSENSVLGLEELVKNL